MRVATLIGKRLRRTWFGSVLALAGLAILTITPVARHCAGIAAKRGTPGGIFCDWTPPLQNPSGVGLIVLLVFAGVIVTLPLALPNRWVLLMTGAGSAALVIGLIIGTTLDFGLYLSLSRLGLALTSDATSAMIALVPASIAWIVASFRLRS
jgi:hypothetical protein